MFVRSAGERDLAAAEALLTSRFAEGGPGPKELRRLMELPRSEFIVADDGAALVGVAFAAAAGDDARIVTLRHLAVRADREGRGVGGMLLEEVEASFFESEIVRVEVAEANARAVRFLEAQGYRQVSRREQDSPPMLTFEKSLLAEA